MNHKIEKAIRFVVQIDPRHDDFESDPGEPKRDRRNKLIANILRNVAEKIEKSGIDSGHARIYSENGENKIGVWHLDCDHWVPEITLQANDE